MSLHESNLETKAYNGSEGSEPVVILNYYYYNWSQCCSSTGIKCQQKTIGTETAEVNHIINMTDIIHVLKYTGQYCIVFGENDRDNVTKILKSE